MPPMVKIPKRSDMYQPPQTKSKNFQPPPVPPKLNTVLRIQATVVRSDEAKAFFVHILFQSPGRETSGVSRCTTNRKREIAWKWQMFNFYWRPERMDQWRIRGKVETCWELKSPGLPNGMACARSLSHRNHPEPNGCRKRAPRLPGPIPRYPRSRTEISQIWWSDASKQVSHKPWYLDGETKNLHLSRDIRIYCTQKSPAAPLGPPCLLNFSWASPVLGIARVQQGEDSSSFLHDDSDA